MTEPWCQTTEVPPRTTQDQIRVSSLCEMGWRPIMITGLFRDMLARHFSEASLIEQADLRRYLWSDNERSGILVESVHRYRGDLVGKRPAILIKRNAYASRKLFLNDFSGTNGRGEDSHTVIWVGSHTLFCIHGTGASVEILATEVQRELTEFAPVVRQYLSLAQYAVTEVGAASMLEEATENFVIPITVAWAYQQRWKLQPEALPLRRVPLSILLDARPATHSCGQPVGCW